MAVEILASPVVMHRGARVGVAGSDVHVPQIHAASGMVVTNVCLWGAPRLPDCGSFRIFTGKDGIKWQVNTERSHLSFVRKRHGW